MSTSIDSNAGSSVPYWMKWVGAGLAASAMFLKHHYSAKNVSPSPRHSCPMRSAPPSSEADVLRCPYTGATLSPSTTSKPDASSPANRYVIRPRRGKEPVQYHSYLHLDSVLNAQFPKSWEAGGSMAHDEMLFIITHQTHELWFKQIMHDVRAVVADMCTPVVEEWTMGKVLERLSRVSKIQKLLIDHLPVLETMTPLSFLEFREYLFPASGFQSMQFRELEVTLGLRRAARKTYTGEYDCALTLEQREQIVAMEAGTSLFDLVDRWLARTPVLKSADFDFWTEYQAAVNRMFEEEREDLVTQLEQNTIPTDRFNARNAEIAAQLKFFDNFFCRDAYETKRTEFLAGKGNHAEPYRLSYEACQAVLMINFYQEEPLFQVPFQFLTLLIEIDVNLAVWRSKHASMVHRMLGLKMGTGGSSGHSYLLDTVAHHKIFSELCNLASLMVPRCYLPQLPPSVHKRMNFFQ